MGSATHENENRPQTGPIDMCENLFRYALYFNAVNDNIVT